MIMEIEVSKMEMYGLCIKHTINKTRIQNI